MYAIPPLADFYAEFDFQASASQIDSAYGLIFRGDDTAGGLDAYYALRLDPGDAQASLNAWKDGVWASKQGFELPNGLLVLDGSNHVRVEAVGSEFRVFANGELAFAVIDTTLPDPGQVGLFLVASGNLKQGDEDIVYFDNLRIYAPAPVTPDPAPEATVTEGATPAGTPAAATPEADVTAPAVVATEPAPATPAAPGVTVVLRDGFDDSASGWEVGDYDGGVVGYGDGYYFITADLEDEVMWGEAGRWFSGIAVEFDVTAVRGPENDLVGYGMKCGIPGDDREVQGYGVFVSADGEYALFRIIKKPEGEIGNNYEPLVDWTASAAIKQGYVTNHLRIECTGNALVLYINDELVDVAQVEGEIEGDIALAAVSFTEETAEVHFEDLVIYLAGGMVPPAPTAPAAPLPVTTEVEAVVAADALNVRGGPGAGYARVGSVAAGDRLPVLGRDARCSWLYVRTPAGNGWVSGTYIDLTASCDLVPIKEIAAAPAPVATPAAPQPVAAPPASGVIADFERFGTWRRGDESWATFTQSGEEVHGGSFSGKLAYDFPANAPEGRNYVVFLNRMPIGGQPATLRIWVYGDGSKSFLNVWVKDATGQIWQFTFGQIQHTGWREMSAPLNPALDWPVQPIGGSATALTYPLALEALVLDYPENRAASGVIYLDDLTAR
ncbi:MAG: SH3 domain-containing protein [Caldilineaceae bacterium]|nr:SH3 domain-containing protein [Caldilineaceae bacterium]